MKIIEDYLKKDLGRRDLDSWEEIRIAYMERAVNIVKRDYQAPSYLASQESQAGRREGTIVGNINDYTRDQHDLAQSYEKKFVKEYLPRVSILPIEAYVTSSGMAALTTAIVALQRLHGVDQTVMIGKHSYFQNHEVVSCSFARVVVFDENDNDAWKRLIDEHNPRAVFVDTLCNEPNLTTPPVVELAKYLSKNTYDKAYLVIDNSMLAIQFDWKAVLKHGGRKLGIIGWESLNKYYQFGMDRTTGGILWGSSLALSVAILQARRHIGTIMPDINVAMLPTPNKWIMRQYLARIWSNREMLQKEIGERAVGDGAQVVIKFVKKMNYNQMQNLIKRIISKAKRKGVQLVAGTSFGLPNTRIYLTARQTKYSEMFLRLSCGTEEKDEFEIVARVIIDFL